MHDRQYIESSDHHLEFDDTIRLDLFGFEELRKLEKYNIFIHSAVEHYTDGTNLVFSVEFKDFDHRTYWYGDNYEFGDTTRAMRCAVKIAWFMHDNPETIGAEKYGKDAKPEAADKLSDFVSSLITEETRLLNSRLS